MEAKIDITTKCIFFAFSNRRRRISAKKQKHNLKKPSSSKFSSKMPKPSGSNMHHSGTDQLHALLRSPAVMERLGRKATFAEVRRAGFIVDHYNAGSAVSAYIAAATRASVLSLGVRLSELTRITRRTVSHVPLPSQQAFQQADQVN